jgi:Domain of unknown function (DUF4440)
MKDEMSPDEVERRFFAGLLEANVEALNQVLSEDFLLIEVQGGTEVSKPVLLEVIGSGQLTFEAIERVESRTRRYGAAAVINGRTQMRGTFGGAPFTAHSRYTHVFVEQQGQWRMVAAQGTPIASA